ncbi:MAG TPA: hypothetical protein VGA88_02575 [Burkholderiales bacterium]
MKRVMLKITVLNMVFWSAFIGKAHSFGTSGVFPSEVKNECSATVHESTKKNYLVATINVVVALKNSKNEVEEKAYIFLDCKGKIDEYTKGTVPQVVGTTCVGVRMNGLDRSSLSSSWIFPIYPNDVKVLSKPGEQPVIVKWEDRSIFTTHSGKSFHWRMDSALTEKTHMGSTSCQ